jgi:hypothetical protein
MKVLLPLSGITTWPDMATLVFLLILRPGLVEDDAANVNHRAVLAVRAAIVASGVKRNSLDDHGIDARDLCQVEEVGDGDPVPELHSCDAMQYSITHFPLSDS